MCITWCQKSKSVENYFRYWINCKRCYAVITIPAMLLHTRDLQNCATVTLIVISEFEWIKKISSHFMIPPTSSRTWEITFSLERSSYSHHSLLKYLPPTLKFLVAKYHSVYMKVHEKAFQYKANLRSAPKLTKEALHPAKVKHSVLVVLAIFNPST